MSKPSLQDLDKLDIEIIQDFRKTQKQAEKTLDFEDQVYWSPQIATSHMYLIYGLFSKYLPNAIQEPGDIAGL